MHLEMIPNPNQKRLRPLMPLCKWRNWQIVDSSGTRLVSTRANTRPGITSYRASSMAGSEYPNHCGMK